MSDVMPAMVRHGSVEIPTKTEFGRELWSHERKPGYDPRNHQYPKMLYKAYKGEDGRVRCMDAEPKPYLYPTQEMYRMALETWTAFNTSCQLKVRDDVEERTAHENGWRESPKEASDAVFAWEKEMATVATETAYQDRNMSPKAKAEFQAAEDATPHILPAMPEKPTVRVAAAPEKPKNLHWKTRQKMERDALKEA